MRFLAFVIFLSLSQAAVACGVPPSESDASLQPLATLTVLANDGEYFVDIVEDGRRGTGRRLRIGCRSGCAGFAPFQAPASGFPLGIFRLSDRRQLILVTWGGATTTTVQVFEIQEHRAVMVFDRHSRSTPRIVERADASLAITTTEYPDYGAGTERPLLTRSWVWDGQRFVEEVP